MRALVFQLLAWCLAVQVTRCSVPVGWYVNGVRPDGMFELRPVLGEPEHDLSTEQIKDDRSVRGRVYCTGGATPRQDGRSVWCER